MTPEQRAATVYALVNLHNIDPDNLAAQLEADGVTIATLTAARDAAQEEIARLRAVITKDAAQLEDDTLEIARLQTALAFERDLVAKHAVALATARADGMREAANTVIPLTPDITDDELKGRRDVRNAIFDAITKEPHHGGATGRGTEC